MDRFESIYQQWSDLADGSYNTLPANPNLTPSQIDLLLAYAGGVESKFLGWNIRRQIAERAKLTDEQFMRFFNDTEVNKKYLAPNPSINPPANKPFASGVFNWRW